MANPNDENFNSIEEEDFYLLVGEKQGVAADEPTILGNTDDERIIIAQSLESVSKVKNSQTPEQ